VTGRGDTRRALLVSLGLAAGLAVLFGELVNHIAPLHGFAASVIANDAAAVVGAAWAVVQMIVHRRNSGLLQVWAQAALGMSLLLVEDRLESIFAQLGLPDSSADLSALLWFAAACLFFACGRRYAMRRYVMAAMRLAIVPAFVAAGAAFFGEGSLVTDSPGSLQDVEEFCEFLAALLFTAALLLTQVAPFKSYRFARAELGRRARRLYFDFALAPCLRYARVHPLLAFPGARYLVDVLQILWFAPQAALAAARDSGRSVPAQVVDLLRLCFVHGIDAKAYYVHGLYRLAAQGAVEETVTRSESKNGLTSALKRLRKRPNSRPLRDKLALWRVCEEHGIPSAAVFACVEGGVLQPIAGRESFDRDLFVKDRKGRGGVGTLNFERVAPFQYRDDRGEVLGLDAVFARLRAVSASRTLLVQPKLANHPSIASLADKTLIVFRVVTCLDQRLEPQVTHGILRIMRRLEPGWPRSPDEDWGCAIDLHSGELGMMTGDAPATCARWFAHHPLTGERVAGRRLEGWQDIARTTLAAHRVYDDRVLIGWDVGWTPEGVRILEGNQNPDFSYFQRVYRTPVGRSPLAPLLNAHLDELTERLLREAGRD